MRSTVAIWKTINQSEKMTNFVTGRQVLSNNNKFQLNYHLEIQAY